MYLCLYKFCILRAKECTIIVSPFLYNLCLLWLLIASIKFFAVFVVFEMSLLFVTWTFRTWAWLYSWWPHSRLDLWVQKNSSFFSEISQGQLLRQGTLRRQWPASIGVRMELGVPVWDGGKFHSLSSFCLVTHHGPITWEVMSPNYLVHFLERIKLF